MVKIIRNEIEVADDDRLVFKNTCALISRNNIISRDWRSVMLYNIDVHACCRRGTCWISNRVIEEGRSIEIVEWRCRDCTIGTEGNVQVKRRCHSFQSEMIKIDVDIIGQETYSGDR